MAPDKIKVNSQTISNEQEIASMFNNYFTDIGKNFADKIDTSNKHPFDNYLHSPSISKFQFKQTNPNEIISVINNLPMKTSSGHDKISCIILKEIKDIIAQPLSLVVNQAFNTGVFPSKLKLAKVIPLYKKGDKTSIENYRPISLLPCMSKVLEKIINIQLYDYFQSNHLLYKSQYGFRKHHSTEFASLELVDTIQQQLDLKLDPFAVFLDMSKAFDTLDHEILLQKFSFYGVQNTSLNLFKSYLSERSQFVSIGGTSSPLRTINTGVPQGSILGPLLFIIYINDLHMASDKFNYILYADDTTLIGNISNFKSSNMQSSITDNINIELDKICDWLAVNKLSLNASKSNYMIFHHRQTKLKSTSIPILEMNHTLIKQVNEFSFLGLTVKNHMDWNSHITNISNKITKTMGIMNRIKKSIPQQILNLMYNSLILPHIYFCITAWGFKCNRIFTLQKKALRIITKSKFNSHTEPLFRELSMLKVEHIFQMQCLKLYYNVINERTPDFFSNMFKLKSRMHTHETRQKNYIHIAGTRTTSAKQCIRQYIPTVLTSIPTLVSDKITTHSYAGFSRYAKQYFIQLYKYECVISNCYICSNAT